MPHERRQARILAMQALCQWEVQRDESETALQDLFLGLGAAPAAVSYAGQLVRSFWADTQGIDRRIVGAAEHWDLGRFSPVDRNAIRVAVVELLDGGVPPAAVLDEAIEIAREFGGADSPRFVNGVLHHIHHEIRRERGGETEVTDGAF